MSDREDLESQVRAALLGLALGGGWSESAPHMGCPFIQKSVVRIEKFPGHLWSGEVRQALIDHPAEIADICHPHFVACAYCDGSMGAGHCKSGRTIADAFQLLKR